MWPWSDSEFWQSGSGLGFDSSCAPRPPPHPPPDPRAGAPGPRKPGICGEPVWPFQRSLISRLFSLSFQMVPWFPQASRGARSPLASGQFSPPPPRQHPGLSEYACILTRKSSQSLGIARAGGFTASPAAAKLPGRPQWSGGGRWEQPQATPLHRSRPKF